MVPVKRNDRAAMGDVDASPISAMGDVDGSPISALPRPARAAAPLSRRRSIRQTGRSPRRLAQEDLVDRRSSGNAGRMDSSSKPSGCQALAMARHVDRSSASMPSTWSAATTDARISMHPPGATTEATPRRAVGSRPTTPRSSEPHGIVIVTRDAVSARNPGSPSAASARKIALGAPRPDRPRAARRDVSAMAAALASIPMTRAPGSAAARARTARPSPVPRSTITRSARAISLAT